ALMGFVHVVTLNKSAQNRPYSPLNEFILEQSFREYLKNFHVILFLDGLTEFDLEYLKHSFLLIKRYDKSISESKIDFSYHPLSVTPSFITSLKNLIITNDVI